MKNSVSVGGSSRSLDCGRARSERVLVALCPVTETDPADVQVLPIGAASPWNNFLAETLALSRREENRHDYSRY
jgi:hypothetical protein